MFAPGAGGGKRALLYSLHCAGWEVILRTTPGIDQHPEDFFAESTARSNGGSERKPRIKEG
ncbi:hypothetical protein BBC27_01825 [Acidithiobacillus ferrivorans]|uniref:Uncharacterized protein n=1 Tax=Acidithiobacillus ferrivorans TaxID=160808 RepID=A0A1B9BVV9_9PROT|nr:hypothetical protein BBC27_01825 [Acidithiobacillus ferrivorans]